MKASTTRSVEQSLQRLGQWLVAAGYRFVTVTPLTHQRVLARPHDPERSHLRDAFGWNRLFSKDRLPADLTPCLLNDGWLQSTATGLLQSNVRFSSLDGLLFAHSPFPTAQEDAVFFGPDTYRFASFIRHQLRMQPLPRSPRIADMGCGAGPGGLVAARAWQAQPNGCEIVLADINPRALLHATANVAVAGYRNVQCVQSDLFSNVAGRFDLIVANPPYLMDDASRVYRHGGGQFGEALSERIMKESLDRLTPGGRLLLYTGSTIVEGRDAFRDSVMAYATAHDFAVHYEELDPDVFGEELQGQAYAEADRIAAVGVVAQRRAA
ncbi:class I SAM-dependent methyltransferase [Acidovorax sp. SUPP3434]|uniref:class I SAM-dependent methyltransferase n=1 Tax=Acidovorax sp. SUPP3434 TaxID=2920880 RepID=UPI0023DE1EDE|nr:class I SAM-dependent methyltransferase [Acidovorax sp. SUPP3434]GKS98004.1 class I SAM-dependent methyltransferase [Acidovorax sp. SUPP3434]